MVPDSKQEVEAISLVATRGGEEIQRLSLGKEALARAAQTFKAYQDQGILSFYDFQFQTSRYLPGVRFPGTLSLGGEEGLVVTHQALLFQTLPDSLVVEVLARNAEGALQTLRKSLAVVYHLSPNKYTFPLRGTWIAQGAPSLNSHHRWGSLQEFALDLGQMGAEGLTHRGDGSHLTDYYAYGAPVLAIADGKVVAAHDGEGESDANLRQPGEEAEAFLMRTQQSQQALLAQGFEKLLGNYVVIEHEHGEYSVYVHLKTGSLQVAQGDRVRQGQQIAALGHSGNSTEPHLHFHLADGPDLAYARSIPIDFSNISLYPDDDGNMHHLQMGQVIMTRE
jgi:murein DD-endopeptidase MepM/ murein hydrolase activator NlpD